MQQENTTPDTVSEIQTSDSDQNTDTDENESDSMGWKNLPDMVMTSNNSDSSDTDGMEWLDNSFYEQNHTISNLEYAKLKLSNFAIKILKTEPITALFDTGATCSCISQQIFKKIADKINMIRKQLKVNTVSGATLGPIGIAPLELNIDDQSFMHNFNVCASKLKQHLILGLDFAQRYRIGIDWDMTRKLFLRCEVKKNSLFY